MAGDFVDLTADDDLDSRPVLRTRPGSSHLRTQDKEPTHAHQGSSTKDPILLDEDDEVVVSDLILSQKPNTHTVNLSTRNDSSQATAHREYEGTMANRTESAGRPSDNARPSRRATTPPPAPARLNLTPPDYGEIILGPGDPPPLYPNLSNFGGPVLVRDGSDGRLPVWIAYQPIPQSCSPPPLAGDIIISDSESITPTTADDESSERDMMEGMDSDEAEELRAAIALSLQESSRPTKAMPTTIPSSTIRISPSPPRREDEAKQKKKQKRDELLLKMRAQRVLEDSIHEGNEHSKQVSSTVAEADSERAVSHLPVAIRTQKAPASASTSSGPTAFNLLTLNRQAMEAERLQRLKRKHEEAEPNSTSSDDMRGRVLARREREQSKTISLSPPPLKRGRLNDGGSLLHGRSTDNKKPQAREISRSQPRESAQQMDTRAASAPAMKSLPSQVKPHTAVESRRAATITSPNAKYFPAGKVFQTFVEGFPTTNTISFPQLIGPKDSLTSCLLSSFIWDFDWLLPHFATAKTKFQFVMHAKWPGQRDALREDFGNINNVRLCFPPMDSIINCMHSKLMLLFYDANPMEMAMAMSMPASSVGGTPPDGLKGDTVSWEQGPRCRIVVPTANLTGSDWGVGGVMENTVFLIDLPVKRDTCSAAATAAGTHQKTAFQKSLVTFLQAQTVPEDVISKLENFDFRSTAQYGFVHTIGGMHGGERWDATGYCGLGRAVSQMGLVSRDNNNNEPEVNFVSSSVGSLNDGFLSAMYLAVQGDSGLAEYRHRTGTTARASNARHGSLQKQDASLRASGSTPAAASTSMSLTRTWRENFQFTFPSDDTVKASIGGPAAAGTVCFSDKYWQNAKFPRQNMRDCVSVRRGCLMHNKLMFVKYPAPLVKQGTSKAYIGWVYVGSANLSESAWGRLVQDKTTKSPKLNCRNWECGVIVPVEKEESPGQDMKSSVMESDNDDGGGEVDHGILALGRVVPVPMKYPCESFEGKKPWLFSEDITRWTDVA
ncbi:hypothetical protein LTR84_006064 [Exophiala bonariae]|uniref:PLD phosphodiesterase domain-containing protein n=1 Tax=Exophiala bonariae TaxID=1690606 RepID=A0AAV9N4Y7_9EURO|nr:hypothetical protein LTR84_006064 [Exophiala bonariae]